MKNMVKVCSTKNKTITPVTICMHILTATVTTNMVNATIFVMHSDLLLFAREGCKKPITIQIRHVAVNLDS
ncbi:hypothetical protein ACHQM5_015408 [Ranunculus cassubicifolius]